MEAVDVAAEEEHVLVVDPVVEADKCQPSAVVSHVGAGCDWGDHRRSLILAAEFSGHKEMGGAARAQGSAEIHVGLPQGIAEQRIAGGVGSHLRKSGKRGGGAGRAPRFHRVAVHLAASALADDVDHAPGAAAVFGREGIGKHVHFLDGRARQSGNDGLAPPGIDAVRAVHLKPGLAAARAVGGEQGLVHEDIALADGRAIGGVQHGEVGDLVAEQRGGVHLGGVENLAQLGLIGANLAGHAGYRNLALPSGDVKLQIEVGGGIAGERHFVEPGLGEARFGGGNGVGARDRKSGDGEIAGGIALRGAFQAAAIVGNGQRHTGDSRVALVHDAAMNGRHIGRLGG